MAEGREGFGRGKWGKMVWKRSADPSNQFEQGSAERRRGQAVREKTLLPLRPGLGLGATGNSRSLMNPPPHPALLSLPFGL